MAFNMDSGLKSIYENLTTILRGDAQLKSMVNYESKNPNIRRGFQTEGEWKTLLVYYFQPEAMLEDTDFSPNFRKVPLIINMWTKENELKLYDISERVIELIDDEEVALTKSGKNHIYNSTYDGVVNEVMYDDIHKAYNRSIRFILTYRRERTV